MVRCSKPTRCGRRCRIGFPPDMVNHSSLNQGREGVRAEIAYWLTAFPDEVPLEEIVAEGDLVSVRHGVIGTHQGEFLGVAPTGKRVSVQEMDIFRIKDGLIVESWSAPDLFGMLNQIGGQSGGPQTH